MEESMIFNITIANSRVYTNLTGADRTVSIGVSGGAQIEVKAPNGAPVQRHVLPPHGGVVSVRVAAQHFLEVDTAPPGVQVEIQDAD